MLPRTELATEDVRRAAALAAGVEILSLERLAGGGNNRIYRGECAGGQAVAVKAYFRDPADSRDRLATEFGACQFMWTNGLRSVPEPLGADYRAGLAVYRFVEGEAPAKSGITARDVDAVLDFLLNLRRLSSAPGSQGILAASEACFSIEETVHSIFLRLDGLRSASTQTTAREGLDEFLTGEFTPFLNKCTARARRLPDEVRLGYSWVIPREVQTLSPSDYGFHNAVRRPDGSLVFMDFEYFGWDDPAKMLSDFLLHPAMSLPAGLKLRFVRRAMAEIGDSAGFPARWCAVYPLWGLKWCLIMLNVYTPEHLRRRQFAAMSPEEVAMRRSQQLEKARALLKRLASRPHAMTVEEFVS